MANVNTVESTIGSWYKNAPHLPLAGRQWLAENVWWLALIGAILSILSLLAIVPILLAALAVSSFAATATVGLGVVGAYTGLYWLSAVISIVSYVVTTALLIMSISPLKAKAKRGWTLLFWSYLISFVLSIAGNIVTMSYVGLVGAVVAAAVAGYFLFEIREYFGVKNTVKRKVVKAKA